MSDARDASTEANQALRLRLASQETSVRLLSSRKGWASGECRLDRPPAQRAIAPV
jgi:hypothetical protein